MNNDAHSILVSALASHGGKLAISDAYCKVYLAGYMADYPAEKQLLIALKQLELPKTIIAYLQSEMAGSDLYPSIKTLEQELSNNKHDLAWGVDAWAAALLAPEGVRRNIRKQCFPLASQQLNSDLEPVFDDKETEWNKKNTPKVNTQKYRGNVLLQLSAIALFGFMTFPLAVGHMSIKEGQPMNNKPTDFASVQNAVFNPPKIIRTEQSSIAQDALADLTLPTVLPKQAKSPVKPRPLNLVIQDTATQRTKRFNAHIEAFLKQKN